MKFVTEGASTGGRFSHNKAKPDAAPAPAAPNAVAHGGGTARAGVVATDVAKVFRGRHAMISYQWDSQEIAKDVYRRLEDVGIKLWMDVSGDMVSTYSLSRV